MNVVRPIPNRNPLPPQSLEAEESVIGGVLVHQRRFEDVLPAPGRLLSPSFARHLRGDGGAARSSRSPSTSLTVAEQMRSMDTIDKLRAFNGPDYLGDLMAKVVTVENIAYHARIVHEKATARRSSRHAARSRPAVMATTATSRTSSRPPSMPSPSRATARRPPMTASRSNASRWSLTRDRPSGWCATSGCRRACGIIGGEPKSFKSFCAAQRPPASPAACPCSAGTRCSRARCSCSTPRTARG
jgi:hypothetical protein